jgi:transposase InsO family protein
MKFGFILAEKALYPVRVLCRVLEVSTAGFYAWCRRKPSRRARVGAALKVHVRASFNAGRKKYSVPRIHADLREEHGVGRRRVARLICEEGLFARRKRRFVCTTDSTHDHPVAPNLLERDFTAAQPNRVWVTDITYVWTAEGWLYLAAILDLYSRRVVGWALDASIDRHLALDALAMAVQARRPKPGLIHHSDRGVQYASGDYQKALKRIDAVCSMSGKGDCWDNAVAESFFATIKNELIYETDFCTRAQARAAIIEYIEVFYNRRRRHSSVGLVSPVHYETAAILERLAA